MVEQKINIFNSFQRSVPYFTETHISRIFKASSGFMMAHFEAYFHVMTVGTSNKCAVNMKIMTRTLQTEANRKFGKEKVKKQYLFQIKHFFQVTSFISRPIVLYMVGKLGRRGILWCLARYFWSYYLKYRILLTPRDRYHHYS